MCPPMHSLYRGLTKIFSCPLDISIQSLWDCRTWKFEIGPPVTGILELDSAGLFLCEISTWPKIILKYSCTVSWIIFHIVFTGLSHSGNRGPWLKLNGDQKPFQLEILPGPLIIFCKVEGAIHFFGMLKSNGATVNLSTGNCSFQGPVIP